VRLPFILYLTRTPTGISGARQKKAPAKPFRGRVKPSGNHDADVTLSRQGICYNLALNAPAR
jgi:hypothetical protein